ncbi:MAG TPA: metallophosphoesterase family protein [Steroidobacteraceae bacterium]
MKRSSTGSNRRIGRHVVHVGVISDTHGKLRPEAVSALQGCALILHAGDIGRAQVLEDLQRLAPRVVAVRGNVDGAWAAAVPDRAEVDVEGHRVLLLHDLARLDLEPRAKGIDVVVSGHSHRPRIERRDGVLYLNPGSAGPRRFRLPVAVARLEVSRSRVDAAIVELDV